VTEEQPVRKTAMQKATEALERLDAMSAGRLPNEQADHILSMLERRTGETLAEVRTHLAELRGLVPGNLLTGEGGALATQQQVAELRDNLSYLTKLLAELPDNSVPLAEKVDDLAKQMAHLPAGPSRLAQDVAALAQQHQDMLQKVGDLEALAIAGQELGATPLAAGSANAELIQSLSDRVSSRHRELDDKLTMLLKDVTELTKAQEATLERVVNIEGWQKAELEGAQDGGNATVAGLVEMVAELREEMDQLRTRPAQAIPLAQASMPAVSHVLGLIVEMKRRIGAISKDRRVDHRGGKYNFRGVDDAMDAVGNACIEVGIVPPRATVVHTSTSTVTVDGKVYNSTVCTMRYTFQSPVDGSEWSTEGIGEGRDLADKSVTKAQAAALKYALFHGLCIPIQGMNIDAETEHLPYDGRPVDQSSHEYRRWANEQERAEQAEYAQGGAVPDNYTREQERADAEAFDRYTGNAEPPGDVQGAARRRSTPGFQTAEDAAEYCKRRGDEVSTLAELNTIVSWASHRDLLDVTIDNAPLSAWLIMASKTKPTVTA